MFISKENLIRIFFLGLFVLTSCSHNDESSPDNTIIAPILDKWWYPLYSGSDDLYISSSGRYEQRNGDTGVITSTGNWILEDKNLPKIKVHYDEDSAQYLSIVWLYFLDIQENSLTVSQSSDDLTFSFGIDYQDTDN